MSEYLMILKVTGSLFFVNTLIESVILFIKLTSSALFLDSFIFNKPEAVN